MRFLFEIIGTVAFAISGAMVGIEKKMDIFGVMILGMTTAVGGGIIRDLILDITPPMAFQHPVYALTAIVTSLIVFMRPVRSRIDTDSRFQIIIDSIGLGIFTVVGVGYGRGFDNLFLSVFVGTVTGCGGGVMRDLFAGDRPMIFVRHFYACASILGAIVSAFIWDINEQSAIAAGMFIIITLRLLAATFKWHLPKA